MSKANNKHSDSQQCPWEYQNAAFIAWLRSEGTGLHISHEIGATPKPINSTEKKLLDRMHLQWLHTSILHSDIRRDRPERLSIATAWEEALLCRLEIDDMERDHNSRWFFKRWYRVLRGYKGRLNQKKKTMMSYKFDVLQGYLEKGPCTEEDWEAIASVLGSIAATNESVKDPMFAAVTQTFQDEPGDEVPRLMSLQKDFIRLHQHVLSLAASYRTYYRGTLKDLDRSGAALNQYHDELRDLKSSMSAVVGDTVRDVLKNYQDTNGNLEAIPGAQYIYDTILSYPDCMPRLLEQQESCCRYEHESHKIMTWFSEQVTHELYQTDGAYRDAQTTIQPLRTAAQRALESHFRECLAHIDELSVSGEDPLSLASQLKSAHDTQTQHLDSFKEKSSTPNDKLARIHWISERAISKIPEVGPANRNYSDFDQTLMVGRRLFFNDIRSVMQVLLHAIQRYETNIELGISIMDLPFEAQFAYAKGKLVGAYEESILALSKVTSPEHVTAFEHECSIFYRYALESIDAAYAAKFPNVAGDARSEVSDDHDKWLELLDDLPRAKTFAEQVKLPRYLLDHDATKLWYLRFRLHNLVFEIIADLLPMPDDEYGIEVCQARLREIDSDQQHTEALFEAVVSDLRYVNARRELTDHIRAGLFQYHSDKWTGPEELRFGVENYENLLLDSKQFFLKELESREVPAPQPSGLVAMGSNTNNNTRTLVTIAHQRPADLGISTPIMGLLELYFDQLRARVGFPNTGRNCFEQIKSEIAESTTNQSLAVARTERRLKQHHDNCKNTEKILRHYETIDVQRLEMAEKDKIIAELRRELAEVKTKNQHEEAFLAMFADTTFLSRLAPVGVVRVHQPTSIEIRLASSPDSLFLTDGSSGVESSSAATDEVLVDTGTSNNTMVSTCLESDKTDAAAPSLSSSSVILLAIKEEGAIELVAADVSDTDSTSSASSNVSASGSGS